MRSANSERDPRCLMKIFQLFEIIVQNFSIGNYLKFFNYFKTNSLFLKYNFKVA